MKIKELILVIILLAVNLYSPHISVSNVHVQPVEVEVNKDVAPVEVNTDELTLANLKMELDKQNVRFSDIVLRQAILETGWFGCDNCSLEYNNLFGFLYKGKYLKFDNWKESVEYYKWWQDQLYRGGDYYAFLTRIGYATAPNYIAKLHELEEMYE